MQASDFYANKEYSKTRRREILIKMQLGILLMNSSGICLSYSCFHQLIYYTGLSTKLDGKWKHDQQ